MFDVSEEDIAKLLIRDAQQLADRAKGMHACAFVYAVVSADWPGQASRVCVCQTEVGVTAYAHKPPQRIRPNEQFLQATLRNVESGMDVLGYACSETCCVSCVSRCALCRQPQG